MDTPTIGLSFLAGLLSFLSPCVLPLLPSYLSFVSGVTVNTIRDETGIRRAVFVNTLMFVLGFSLVFVVLGVLFSGTALFFPGATRIINIIAGAIVVLLGLNIVFDFIKVLNLEARLHLNKKPQGLIGSFLVGLAFAAGWTPCIGPILTGILFLAGTSGNIGSGVLYLVIYSAGLAVPFLLTALFFGSATALFARIKRHFATIRIVTGSFLVTIGALIAVGRFQELNILLLRSANAVSRWSEANPQAGHIVPVVVLLVAALMALLPTVLRAARRIRPVLRRVESTVVGALVVVALLQATRTIDLATMVSRWLAFQGL